VVAELFADHDGFGYGYVFCGVVHFYRHVDAHGSVPVSEPYEAFFLGFLYEEVECVGCAAVAVDCGVFGYGVAFLFEVVCDELF